MSVARDAGLVAALVALDPAACGGVVLRGAPGPARERWLDMLRALLPAGAPVLRMPAGIAEDRLIGGLDLAAALAAGRPVMQRGLLAEADGGVLVAAMAERLPPATAGVLAAVLDTGELAAERDGLAARTPARIGVVALDEGEGDEAAPAALAERLAFALSLDGLRPADLAAADAGEIAAARALLPRVRVPGRLVEGLVAAGAAFGIASLRAPVLAVAAARLHAALFGRAVAAEADAEAAARLVFPQRARRLPSTEAAEQPAPPEPRDEAEAAPEPRAAAEPPTDLLVAAAAAALPPDALPGEHGRGPRAGARGRAGATRRAREGGRPAGTRPGAPGAGGRLALVATLRAAAPWQGVRGRTGPRVEVRRADFRIERREQKGRTLAIFAVDASGSSALGRLAEAKGAVELLLGRSYARRDEVALVAFRGAKAELVLPPTRSLARAKRSLAAMIGGGGTPLAAGIEAAARLADAAARRGDAPSLVLLTDGQANVARNGAGGRAQGAEDALAAARLVRRTGVPALLVDTSARPRPAGRELADAMGARYLALPHADARALSRAVAAAAPREQRDSTKVQALRRHPAAGALRTIAQ
jgi:magnesium chelatase subunit D